MSNREGTEVPAERLNGRCRAGKFFLRATAGISAAGWQPRAQAGALGLEVRSEAADHDIFMRRRSSGRSSARASTAPVPCRRTRARYPGTVTGPSPASRLQSPGRESPERAPIRRPGSPNVPLGCCVGQPSRSRATGSSSARPSSGRPSPRGSRSSSSRVSSHASSATLSGCSGWVQSVGVMSVSE